MIHPSTTDQLTSLNFTANDENAKENTNAVKKALAGDYTSESCEKVYASWSETYDDDVAKEQYCAPETVYQLLNKKFNGSLKNCNILDVGCGTGLFGELLFQRDRKKIDGLDISAEMVEAAVRKHCYSSVQIGGDLNHPMDATQQYNVVVVIGVFTSGHVKPYCVKNLESILQEGGIAIISARKSYAEEMEFDRQVKESIKNTSLFIAEIKHDLPYIKEEGADYYIIQKKGLTETAET